MDIHGILKYGHITITKELDALSQDIWEIGGACGHWSVKNIIAHLASYENLVMDIFNSVAHVGTETPTLKQLFRLGDAFNDVEVEARQSKSVAETLAEYTDAQAKLREVVAHVPLETIRTAGVLPWYGAEYDLEDVFVYMMYGHKREHAAQVAAFRDRNMV